MSAPTLLPPALSVYELADLAGVELRDEIAHGARMLALVQQVYREEVDRFHDVCDMDPSTFAELAGGCVPASTADAWRAFVGLAAYREDMDPVDLVRAGGVSNIARPILADIAERLLHALHQRATEWTAEHFPNPARCVGCGVYVADMIAEVEPFLSDGCSAAYLATDGADREHEWTRIAPSAYVAGISAAPEATSPMLEAIPTDRPVVVVPQTDRPRHGVWEFNEGEKARFGTLGAFLGYVNLGGDR